MESMTPIKKNRTNSDVNNMRLIECRREFVLFQQYPSTVVPGWNKLNSAVKVDSHTPKQCTSNPHYTKLMPQTLKVVPGKNIGLLNNIKKLRIKSKDGRDLGEMNVQFLSQKDNTLHGKMVAVTKPAVVNKLNKPVKISFVSPETNNKSLSISPVERKELPEPIRLSFMPKPITSARSELERSGALPQRSPIALKTKQSKQCRMCKSNNLPQRKNVESQVTCKTPAKVPVANTPVKYIKVVKDVTTAPTEGSKTLRVSELPSTKDRQRITVKPDASLNKPIQSKSELNSTWYEQIARSKFPIVKCERLLPVAHTSVLAKKRKENREENDEGKDVTKILKTEIANEERSSVRTEPEQSSTITSSKENHLLKQRSQKSTTTPRIRETSNTRTADKVVLRKPTPSKDAHCVESFNTRNDASITVKIEEPRTQNLTIPSLTVVTDKTRDATNLKDRDQAGKTNPSVVAGKEKLSDSLSIIQKALSSVTDEELRKNALQALADCGIGIEKLVPIPPPEQLRSVHDSQTQTEIFSLLEKENFVLVRKEMPNLQRIKPPDSVLSSPSWSSQNNLITSDNPILGCTVESAPVNNSLSQQAPVTQEEIDELLNTIFSNENTEARQVGEVLSAPNGTRDKIILQMNKDFETRRQFDADGLLNIHRAVRNGHLRDMQRHLMVLKACKESVDLETIDGETSLELAIKYDADEQIVKALLQAGAQPVSEKPLHDSAVLLASKYSSPLLPELLKYVTKPSLLDQIDSDGYAAIHYAVQENNLGNVKALIKAGCNVDLRDKRSGRSPFFHATEKSYSKIAETLLDAGATMSLPNFAGQTVMMYAGETTNLSLRSAIWKHMSQQEKEEINSRPGS